MAIILNTALKNKYLDAVQVLTEGGTIQLRSATDVVLGSVAIGANAFGPAVAGEATLTAPLDIPITVSGTATKFRILNSDPLAYREGTVGITGADMNFSSNVFNALDTARILTWRLYI